MEDCSKIKKGASRELFLPENDFQIFQKNIYISEASKPTEDMKFRLDMNFFCKCPSTYEFNTILKLFWALNRNISKLWVQNYKKIIQKG